MTLTFKVGDLKPHLDLHIITKYRLINNGAYRPKTVDFLKHCTENLLSFYIERDLSTTPCDLDLQKRPFNILILICLLRDLIHAQ